MEQTTTQSPANPGASNATDFQPGTQNPQAAPAQLFSQPTGVQSGGQDSLLEDKNVRISVPVTNPAPAQPSAARVNSGNGEVFIALVIAAIVAAWLVWRRHNRQRPVSQPVEIPEPVIKKTVVAPAVKARPKPVVKKAAPKKSKSQRKKRARR